jgi:hypothetical protein
MPEWQDNGPGQDDWLFTWKFWVIFVLAMVPCIATIISKLGGNE